MKFIITLLAISFINQNSYANAAKIEQPRIKSNGTIELGSQITEGLKTIDSDFALLQKKHFSKTSLEYGDHHPMAVVADFNGDGYKDIVVLGQSKSKKTVYIYGFVSNEDRQNYEALEITSSPIDNSVFKNNPMYLTLLSKGKIKNVTRDLVQVETYGLGTASVQSYYYSKTSNKFKFFRGQLD